MLSAWAELPLNRILVIAATIFALLVLKSYLELIPLLQGALIRSRGNIEIEHSVSMARSRNRCALVGLLILALLVSRYQLYPVPFLKNIPSTWSVAVAAAVLIAYLLLRLFLFVCLTPRKLDSEGRKALHKAIYNYFLCALPLLLTSSFVLWVFKVPTNTIRWFLWVELALFWSLSLMRERQILLGKYSSLKSFLYLCALEVLPLSGLVILAAMFQ